MEVGEHRILWTMGMDGLVECRSAYIICESLHSSSIKTRRMKNMHRRTFIENFMFRTFFAKTSFQGVILKKKTVFGTFFQNGSQIQRG